MSAFDSAHCVVPYWPQDLALMFQDEHDKSEIWAELEECDAGDRVEAPDMMRLLDGISVSCPVCTSSSVAA